MLGRLCVELIRGACSCMYIGLFVYFTNGSLLHIASK